MRILPLVETARGLLAGPEIAAANPRIVTLCFGSGDFTCDLELPSLRCSTDGSIMPHCRVQSVYMNTLRRRTPRPWTAAT